MDNIEIVKLVIGSGGLIGICVLIFKAGAFSKNIEGIASDVKHLACKADKIESDVRKLDGRMSHIEGYLMGRDIRNGTENR